MRTLLSVFPGWLKVARSNLSNLRPHPDPANHDKVLLGDGTFADQTGGPGGGAGVSFTASSNSSGNTTIAPTESIHTEETAVSGSGSSTRIFVLDTSGAPEDGAIIRHRVTMPTTAAITLEWRNATADGTLETSWVSDVSGDDLVAEFYFNGTAWKFLRFTAPANA